MMTPADPAAPAATRAEAQRERILNAALKCFVESGFHAASMANIADAAQMSAGLMYRYFENKNAIVLAIIERQLEEKRCRIRQLQSTHNFKAGILEAFDQWRAGGEQRGMNPALFLEMSAEATRDPQIAAALRDSDVITRNAFKAWLARSTAEGGLGLPDELAGSRALQLQLVVEGLMLRAVREPDIDRKQLDRALECAFARMLAP
jgi:AcrR family transcriptional regulator